MGLQTHEVQNVSDLVSHILGHHEDGRKWFRGQGCHRRPLRPTLFRRIDPFTAQKLIDTERRLITRFRQRSLPLWPEGYPQNDWEHMFAMQHFGVPTRLLDWSENALVAAYFAADHNPTLCECEQGDCKPTVWVLDPVKLNQGNPRFDGYGDAVTILATTDRDLVSWSSESEEQRLAQWPVAIYGTHNSARIVAQQGTFTLAGRNDAGLEETIAVTSADGVLEKVTVTVDRESIQKSLRTLGISRGSVFPDLAGLSHDVATAEL